MSKVKTNNYTPIEIVGRTLSREAKLLARVVSPRDQPLTMAIARALRDPERVQRLVDGLVPADLISDQQDNRVPA